MFFSCRVYNIPIGFVPMAYVPMNQKEPLVF
jgi:hypothetical protein